MLQVHGMREVRRWWKEQFPCQGSDKEAFLRLAALSPILVLGFDALFGLQMYTHSKGSPRAEMSGRICYSTFTFRKKPQ